MFRKNIITTKTTLNSNDGYEGETIEKKMRRILNNNEPIVDGAPIVYTERKDGVRPEFNIRTDTWEIACEAMDAVNQAKLAQRTEKNKTPAEKEADKIAAAAKAGMGKEGEAPPGAN